jgi:hypothetical protein
MRVASDGRGATALSHLAAEPGDSSSRTTGTERAVRRAMGTTRATLLLLVGACGRLGFDSAPPPGEGSPPIVVTTEPSLAPTVCAASTLGTVVLPAPPVDVTVTATPTGAVLLWTPQGGGLYGLEVDAAGSVVGNPGGTQIRSDPWIHSIASTYVDDVLIVAAQDDINCISVDLFATGLGSFQEIDHMAQVHAPKVPIVKSAGVRVVAASFDDQLLGGGGVSFTPFDTNWNPQSPSSLYTTAPVTAIATTGSDTTAVAAWSTATTCQLTTLTNGSPGSASLDLVPCASPRLAASKDDLVFAFESFAGVRAVRGVGGELGAAGAPVIAPGSSPRVVFDGAHYWLSYVDASWSLVVGYLDTDGRLHTTDLGSVPASQAYELVVVDGAPWVYAAEGGTFTATKVCAP